jgi:hypothetical protein
MELSTTWKLKILFSPFQKVQELENPMCGLQNMAQWISEKTRNQEAITTTWLVQIASSLYAQTPFDMYFKGASLYFSKKGQCKKSLFNWTVKLDQGQNRPNVKIFGILRWDFL